MEASLPQKEVLQERGASEGGKTKLRAEDKGESAKGQRRKDFWQQQHFCSSLSTEKWDDVGGNLHWKASSQLVGGERLGEGSCCV